MNSRPETLRPAQLAGPARSGSRPQGDKAGEFFARALAATRNGCLSMTAGYYGAGWWQVVQLSTVKLAWLSGAGLSFPAPWQAVQSW
jgi:hypothetical protein